MNFIKFATGTTNIFPLANSHSGGQLLSEFNLRSRETVHCGPTSSDKRVDYAIGPSYVNSEDDFKVTSVGRSPSFVISSGRAIVNGHFVESLVDITIDLAEANVSLIKEQKGVLKGSLVVGLKAMYSTEATIAGTMAVENSNNYYEGIQVVVLPKNEFILPEQSREDPSRVTAHIKLASIDYSNGQVNSIVNNYPAKCQIISADRIANVDGLLSDSYLSKKGLQPGGIYTFSGKGYEEKDTWCNSLDSLIVWDKNPTVTLNPPESEQAEFRVASSGSIYLELPHKQVDGYCNTNGDPIYYKSRALFLPAADYNSGTSGTVSKSYTDSIKRIEEKVLNFYHLTSGKQRGYVEEISSEDRSELPTINQDSWNAGDYVLVGSDNSIVDSITSSILRQPSTIYVVIPPLVTSVQFVASSSDNSIPSSLSGSEIRKISLSYANNDKVPETNDKEVYNEDLKISSSDLHGDINKDYVLVEYTDIDTETNKEYTTRYYYKVSSTSGKKVYSSPVCLTGQVNLATDEMIGGFLNVPDNALDAGYIYRDSNGHLRLLDYALLRSGTLAYQLDSDKQYGPGLTAEGIQEQLDEYVNDRIAFKTETDGSQSIIQITLTLSKEETESTVTIKNIDSRFGTSVYIDIQGDADENTVVNIVNCQKVRINNNIGGTPVINLYNSCLYYDAVVISYLNVIQDMKLWYEKYESTDPSILVNGMTVMELDAPVITDSLDYWSEDVPNDNHYLYALQSITFAGDGTIIGAGIYIKNNTTANVSLGPSIIASQFNLPQGSGSGLSYPENCLTKPVKITGAFVTAYPQPDTLEYRVIKTHFTALSQTYNYETKSSDPGTISFLTEASSIGSVVGIDPSKEIDGWSPVSFHSFQGKVIG